MHDAAYRKRLAADLPAWRERGWVGDEGSAAILMSLGPERPGLGITALIMTLGALLLGLGAVGLVAANWEEIPRLVRFFALLAALGLSYLSAFALHRRGHPALAEAALLLAGLVFAAAIALVGQSYHLSGDFADAVLLWSLGCLGAALLAGSPALTLLALVGAAYWTGTITLELRQAPHLGGLALILVAGAVATLQASRPARAVAILALGFWIVATLMTVGLLHSWRWSGTVVVGLSAMLALWAAGMALSSVPEWSRLAALGADLVHPALASAIVGLAFLQTGGLMGANRGAQTAPALLAAVLVGVAVALGLVAAARGRLGRAEVGGLAGIGACAVLLAALPIWASFSGRLLGAAIVLAAALWTVWLGQEGRQAGAKRLGLTAFGLEVAYVYVVTLGTMLDTALSLIVGGLLFIGLALLVVRINRALAARQVEA